MNRTVTRHRRGMLRDARCLRAMPFIVERSLGGVSYDLADSSIKITHYAEPRTTRAPLPRRTSFRLRLPDRCRFPVLINTVRR